MASVAYIGDELSGAGYRLAGARVYPAGGEAEVHAALERACAENELVLVNAGCAARLAPGRLAALLRGVAPLLLVVQDGSGGRHDVVEQMKRRIGLQP